MDEKSSDPSPQPAAVPAPQPATAPSAQENATQNAAQTGEGVSGVLGSFTRGILNTSQSAVKAVQVKARHLVSQNKRRYQEGGFDLDMTYITENIIAMGFPAGDISSGFFGYVEGFYRNHMDEVIRFFESHHKGHYKVYNLCSERLYDASRFEGKAASFPFDDHNCPPIQLIGSFCQSAHSWLKEDIENVVVVHCKAGMARTGVMICSLLLYLKFFPTAKEAIYYYNHKRCVDGKAMVLPSQIRYVKYYDNILRNFNGESHPRRCMLRGFRIHNCPYWIRPTITISDHNGILFSSRKHPKTKDLMPEDFWINARKKGIVVFALPGEPGVAELVGDFKIYFHERQGDFYCWLNTMTESNRIFLKADDLDGFEKRKLPSPRIQVEVILIDYNGTSPTVPKADSSSKKPVGSSNASASSGGDAANHQRKKDGDDDVFSDSEGEEPRNRMSSLAESNSGAGNMAPDHSSNTTGKQMETSARTVDSPSNGSSQKQTSDAAGKSGGEDIRAIAADASVFSFGDEDFDSE